MEGALRYGGMAVQVAIGALLASCHHLTVRAEGAKLTTFVDALPACAEGEWQPEAHFSSTRQEEQPVGPVTVNGRLQRYGGTCTTLYCPGLPEACCNGCGGRWVLADEIARLPLTEAKDPNRWFWGAQDCTLHALSATEPSRQVQVVGAFVEDPLHEDVPDELTRVAFRVERICALGFEVAEPRGHRWQVPTRLRVGFEGSATVVDVDDGSFRWITVAASKGLWLGLRSRLFIEVGGQRRVIADDASTTPSFRKYTLAAAELPSSGAYRLGLELTAFETDVPPSKAWRPDDGRRYHPLHASVISVGPAVTRRPRGRRPSVTGSSCSPRAADLRCCACGRRGRWRRRCGSWA
jgi:hypothetical protein